MYENVFQVVCLIRKSFHTECLLYPFTTRRVQEGSPAMVVWSFMAGWLDGWIRSEDIKAFLADTHKLWGLTEFNATLNKTRTCADENHGSTGRFTFLSQWRYAAEHSSTMTVRAEVCPRSVAPLLPVSTRKTHVAHQRWQTEPLDVALCCLVSTGGAGREGAAGTDALTVSVGVTALNVYLHAVC